MQIHGPEPSYAGPSEKRIDEENAEGIFSHAQNRNHAWTHIDEPGEQYRQLAELIDVVVKSRRSAK
jgi:hypothetical protein